MRGALLALLVVLLLFFGRAARAAESVTRSAETNAPSRLLEAAGLVEHRIGGRTNWSTATAGLVLNVGDHVRTRAASRAALQLSDRSIIRVGENTTLEVLPPRRAERKRFGLRAGWLYFFNREKPADVEFDTPLAAGAIRGTEFWLTVEPETAATEVGLIDGQVAMQTSRGEVAMERGQKLQLASNAPPVLTAMLTATPGIQWALYYPAVVDPAELALSAAAGPELVPVLEAYRAGDLLGALAAWPVGQDPNSPGEVVLRAQLELAVGRVIEAERLLAGLTVQSAPAAALQQVIELVRNGEAPVPLAERRSASEILARSYGLQSAARLPEALAAARQAALIAPTFGFAHARVAELEFAHGNRRAALAALGQARLHSPRLAMAESLAGFIALAGDQRREALACFDRARALDAAFGPAWLGRGLCLLQQRDFAEARASFQAAAALEPQRGLFRSYLGKAASELGDASGAEKEFGLAKELDERDPTAWLYSALHLWQANRLNEAIRDLEQSRDRNDQRAVFRSRLLLDQDRSVRSANLAALYAEAGLPDASLQTAARAVSESYANFSGHLFLANSLGAQEGPYRFDLRQETARQSELLVANLLAPPGAGNLSQALSQQDHLRFFDPRPLNASSLTEYGSGGYWRQLGTIFGALEGFSYAVDANYESLNGQQPNGELERSEVAFTLKQRVTGSDELYLQVGYSDTEAGDVARHYDPQQAQPGFHVQEEQQPTLYAGWHHEWSPGSHTLFLAGRLEDHLSLRNPDHSVLFLRTDLFGTAVESIQSGPLVPPVELDFTSDFTLYSAELQHVWESPRGSLVVGGRWQSAEVETHAELNRIFPATDDRVDSSLERGNAYAYGSWRVLDPLRLIAGVSYDHLTYPENADLPPLREGEDSRDLLAPKAGLLFEPWQRGLLRASYTESLGGLYFDNSVRLEPTHVAGLPQAFRSLFPESAAGLVPGTKFVTKSLAFDQSLPSGTWFGVELAELDSDGEREVGAFQSFVELLAPETATATRERLHFRERNLAAYAGQLVGRNLALAGRYRWSEAKSRERFPELPDVDGLDQLEADDRATLEQVSLTATYQHRAGGFARWESLWWRQDNAADSSSLGETDFWQHNLTVGWRFARRRVEWRAGVLNLFDQDYRLNPLNFYVEPPRERTFVTSLRLNF